MNRIFLLRYKTNAICIAIQDIYVNVWFSTQSLKLFPHPFLPQTQAYLPRVLYIFKKQSNHHNKKQVERGTYKVTCIKH